MRTLLQRFFKKIWRETTGLRMHSAQTLPDKAFLGLFDLGEISALLEQGDTLAAKAALLDHYRRRETPAWPAPPSSITDLRLDTDELTREELVARANSILEFSLSPEGTKPQLTSEGKIKWCSNPVSSPEWLWRLNRHQWWPVLGLAYAQTGDERCAAAFVNQMLDWIANNPPPSRKDEKSPTWRLMETGMRMSVSWIPAFALFYKSPAFTDEAKLTMLRSIYDHARFLSLFKTKRNHLLRESNGLAYVSIYFPEFKEAEHWQQVALARLDQELTNQINQDGSHIEVSTGYQWVVVDEFEKTYDLLTSNNIAFPSERLASKLEIMYHVLASLVRPDGTFPEINDGFIRWQHTRIAQAGKKFGRDDFNYIATWGKQGVAPRNTSVGFDDAGWYVMRNDWTRDSRYLLFDAGPYGGFHGHEDKLSIELFAFGQAFIVDSGSYTYERTDPFRTYFVGSQGHNTVLVDGQSQIRRWQEPNMDPKPVPGNYATWISRAEYDYVAATYNDGYSSFRLKKPEKPLIIKDAIHTRRILFVKPDYWIMLDELQASDHHNYQLLFHAPPEIVVRIEADKRVVLNAAPDSAFLYLIPICPHNFKVTCLAGSENPIQGWYSVDHHCKTPSAVVIYELENSLSTVFTTLLYPCRAGHNGDEVSVAPLEIAEGEGLAFVVNTSYGTDYLMLSQNDRLKKFGLYQSRGAIAGIRTDRDGNVVSQFEARAHDISET